MNILVTGAAGLIGGAVCARLAARGHRVVALVHRRREICDNAGRRVPVARIVDGDVGRDNLGLDAAPGGRIDLVIHCAASVRFDLAEADYAAINVEGTRRAIAFCRRAGAAMLYVSTAFAAGRDTGPVAEAPAPADAVFANGYEASKARAERLVRESGLAFAIARPSIVLGEARSGRIRDFGAIYAAFRLIAEGRIVSLPATPGATLDFVPIDHVADGLVRLAERMTRASGGIFHLVSDAPLPVGEFAAAIGSYRQFASPRLVDAGRFDPRTLPPAERRLHRRVFAPYAAYFRRSPEFDDAAFRALTGQVAPPCGGDFLHRQIAYCIAAGFLPGDGAQRISG